MLQGGAAAASKRQFRSKIPRLLQMWTRCKVPSLLAAPLQNTKSPGGSASKYQVAYWLRCEIPSRLLAPLRNTRSLIGSAAKYQVSWLLCCVIPRLLMIPLQNTLSLSGSDSETLHCLKFIIAMFQ